ncbi:MAG: GNAT family N-acetyltransferase [Candidatus Zixiibacteriota bacterium]
MEIVTYRELETKDDFMVLMEMGFGSPVTPATFEQNIKGDLRLKNGPVGFCAVENGRLVGYVGVLDISTRTVEGTEEIVGGIYAVATNSRFAKRGICKTLMERAHQHFNEKKYPFCFLTTSRTIIAYALYVRMGYVEVEKVNQYPIAYKVLRKNKEGKKLKAKLNYDKIYQIHQEFVTDKTGFVIRQKDFRGLFAQCKSFDEKKSIQEQNGYALIREVRKTIKIQELVSLDDLTYEELLEQVESIAPSGVLDRLVTNERLLKIYKARGYSIQEGSNAVLMVKKLGDRDFEDAYGNKFHIGLLDYF